MYMIDAAFGLFEVYNFLNVCSLCRKIANHGLALQQFYHLRCSIFSSSVKLLFALVRRFYIYTRKQLLDKGY